ncbi:MAG: ABC transporter substrate-binding protein [Dehalococcoidia bacterium]
MRFKLLIGIILASFLLIACSTSTSDTAPAPDRGAAEVESQVDASSQEAPAQPESDKPASSSPPAGSADTPASAPPSQPSSAQGTSPSLAIKGTGQAREGGKLVRLFRDPPTLDPHLTADNISGILVNEVFGGLVTIDPELNIVPDLAESWDISADGTRYTFHLRRNAKFHNGKPVTADDVRWSLERVTDPATQSPVAEQYLSDIVGVKAKLRGEADSISGVRVIDDHTLGITIDGAKSYFVAKLTYPTAFVLDRENVEGNPDNWLREPNGTGPFRLAQYEIGEVLLLGRNDNYHLEPAHLDEVEFILGGGAAMLMYENDEIDLTGVGLADLERVLDPNNALNAEVHQAPSSFSVSYIGLNVNQPPLDDPRVRQALNYSVNKQTIATQVLEGAVIPARGILPPGFPAYNPDLKTYDYNIEKAKQLLQESSYGGNLEEMPRITVSISGSFGANVPLDLEVILQTWEQELGLNVEIQQTEWATFLQDLHAKRFQMFTVAWGADYPDPENYLDVLFHSESENNQTNYHNPQVDALLERARVEPNRDKRFQMYNQIEQLILDDAPWIPLWNSGEQYVLVKPKVNDYFLTPMTIQKYRYVYLSQE